MKQNKFVPKLRRKIGLFPSFFSELSIKISGRGFRSSYPSIATTDHNNGNIELEKNFA